MKRIFIFLTLPLILMACSSENNNNKKQPASPLSKVEHVTNSATKVASEKHKQHVAQAQTMTKDVVIVAAQTPQHIVPAVNGARSMTNEVIVAAIEPHSAGAQSNVHGHSSLASNVYGHGSQEKVVVASNGSDVVIYEND